MVYLMCEVCRDKSDQYGNRTWPSLREAGWYADGEHVYCPTHRRIYRARKRERRADRQRQEG